MDLGFKKPEEIVKILCERLRKERLSQEMSQGDVAARAGLSTNTVSNLEAGKGVGFENIIRVARVLGRANELDDLFSPRLTSLNDIQRYEENAHRHRAKRKPSND